MAITDDHSDLVRNFLKQKVLKKEITTTIESTKRDTLTEGQSRWFIGRSYFINRQQNIIADKIVIDCSIKVV